MTLLLLGARTGNCQRAAIALEESGLAYDVKQVDLRSNEHHSSEFLKLNPLGKVPVLTQHVNGIRPVVICQSNAIMLYTADNGLTKLLPDITTSERATALERFFYFVTDVIAPNHAGFFLKQNKCTDEAMLLQQNSIAALERSERYLDGSPYMAGDSFTLADICAVTMTRFSEGELRWSKLPNLKRWYEDVSSRPGVERGMRAFDPGGHRRERQRPLSSQ
ncbi:glutathione S-transferase family protein [Paraburkholderia caribensis]|uniref:glutathione S-transferase family protein n=1 Tax=Paraburkholderia caribensis TaxID=75105 RepID=UPI001CB03CA0|nr:glutathione S-transferase family protein [Paraburkholderia caribensis]CAG9249525.1 Glutathione S-transferase [Paraburkholderia caribensis]